MRLVTQNASTSPTQTAIEGRCFPCVPVRSAYPKNLNLMNETILGDHVQHVFLYKKDLNITQQVSLENMLNQTPLAHGVATTLPDALRVRITRKTCCQNQTQRLSQVRVSFCSQRKRKQKKSTVQAPAPCFEVTRFMWVLCFRVPFLGLVSRAATKKLPTLGLRVPFLGLHCWKPKLQKGNQRETTNFRFEGPFSGSVYWNPKRTPLT